jgi:hypothetical protein
MVVVHRYRLKPSKPEGLQRRHPVEGDFPLEGES